MDRVIHCIVYASLSLVLILGITKGFFNKGQLPELFQRAIKTRREQIQEERSRIDKANQKKNEDNQKENQKKNRLGVLVDGKKQYEDDEEV